MQDDPLVVGKPVSPAWREEMLARVHELEGLTSWVLANRDGTPHPGGLDAAISAHLSTARTAAEGHDVARLRRTWRRVNGSAYERVLANLDAVEVDLLRLAPADVVKGALPGVQAHVNRFLAKDDPRRLALGALARADKELTGRSLDVLLGAQHAANTQRRRNLNRLRTFRNLLVSGTLVFLLIAVALAVYGSTNPEAIPLCFTPQSGDTFALACPRGQTELGDAIPVDLSDAIRGTVTGGDVLLVEFMGLLGAALAGAAALRNLHKGTTTPYGVPVALAVVKLPTGALTAVAGIILMRADFVPGLSALDNSAQILGWAVVFGIAQQLVTRFADSQAAGLLENVGGRGAGGDRPLKA